MSPVVAPGLTAAIPRIILHKVTSISRSALRAIGPIAPRTAGIAVPAIDDEGDVDIDDIAFAGARGRRACRGRPRDWSRCRSEWQ